MRRIAATLACVVSLSGSALAQSREEVNALGTKLVAAFSCAALAGMSGQYKEEERLFKIGLEAGRAWIPASRRIEAPFWQVPIVLLVTAGHDLMIRQASVDFILGDVFGRISEGVYRSAWEPNGKVVDDAVAKSYLRDKYRAANCSLIR